MSADTTAPTDGQPNRLTPADVAASHPQRTYTQAELDRIIRTRLNEAEAAHARDADAQSAQAGDDRDDEHAAARDLASLRATVANRHGISEEDRDILLTATDEATLELQAARFAEMRPQHHRANVAPREGLTVARGSDGDREMREFASELFERDPYA